MKTKIITTPLIITLLILIIPFFGNIYVDGWNWTPMDFVGMGSLIFLTGLTYQLITLKAKTWSYKVGTFGVVTTSLLLIWVNLAVGFIGDENPANLLFLILILIGFVCAILVRFEPLGMTKAALGAAVIQLFIPIIALFFWSNDFAPGVLQVMCINFVFVLFWLGSAMFYRHASLAR